MSQSWRAVSSPESIEAPGGRIRIFLDASAIFAAAYSSTGASRELALAADIRDRRVLLVTAWVFEEAERNLQRKAPQGLPILRLLKDEALWTLIREPSRRQVLQAERVVAFKDAPVVAGALKARADFLATFDQKDLLSKADEIEARFGLKVSTPGDVLASLREL